MAKRKYSGKRNKIQPAVQTLVLSLPSTSAGASTVSYADLSQIACLVNRRFYRQGINWAVAGFKFFTATPAPGNVLKGEVTMEKLPNTWVMANAWEKAMRSWTKMNREALAENESVRPKFLDFKIYADAGHHAAGYGSNLLPFAGSGVATAGEWIASKVSIPRVITTGLLLPGATEEREMIAVGASYPGASPVTGLDAVSLIEGYAASRGLPNVADPNTPDDASDIDGGTPENWLTAIFNEGTQQKSDVIDDMISENDIAPYPFENDGVNTDTMYPGGANQLSGLQIHDSTSYGASTIGGTTRIKGGNFPCGLIKITHSVANDSQSHNIALYVDLVPGHHRGYLCENMTEM